MWKQAGLRFVQYKVGCVRVPYLMGVTKRYLFNKNPLGDIVDDVDKLQKADLKRDMSIGTGVLVGQEILENPAIKLVQPQPISPPTPFPKIESSGVTMTIYFRLRDIQEKLKEKGYKMLIVIEKRHFGGFISNYWRNAMAEKFPKLEVIELILVHQISSIVFFPFLWIVYMRELQTKAADSTFVHIGPCRKFMKEIKILNPYVPNIYLINSKGEACWMTSSGPTEEDVEQLSKILASKPKSATKNKKE